MLDLSRFEIFKNKETLRNLSKDISGESVQYMVDLGMEAINFDKVKTIYLNNMGYTEEKAKSVDALLKSRNRLFFIEFKNCKIKNNKKDIFLKAKDSVLIFCDISTTDIDFIRKTAEFILVYNKDKNPSISDSRSGIIEHLEKKANEKIIHFEMDKMEGYIFNKVYTFNEKEFEDYISTL